MIASTSSIHSPEQAAFLRAVGDRASGGADVAAMPNMEQEFALPRGPAAPAADEAIQWLTEGIPTAKCPQLLFLVGGPGSGKSALASHAVERFSSSTPQSPLALRSYAYETGNAPLLLVNDATIEGDSPSKSPLADEIDHCIATFTHLIANVNRGILFEELAAPEIPDLGAAVIRWLNGKPQRDDGIQIETLLGASKTSFLRVGRLKLGATRVDIVAVYMDVCSLFEVRPHTTLDKSSGHFSIDEYKVQRFDQRNQLSESSTIASDLLCQLSEIADALFEGTGSSHPVTANIRNLTSDVYRTGLCSLLRGAEVTAGKRFTYRELWGAIALAILGTADPLVLGMDLTASPAQGPGTDHSHDAQSEFARLTRLSTLRSWQAVFGAHAASHMPESSSNTEDWNPVLRFSRDVDPVRDTSPIWAPLLYDAFNRSGADHSPLETILSEVGEDHPLQSIVMDFDRDLDAAFVRAVSDPSLLDVNKRQFEAWYGCYLTRMLAISAGRPAFENEIIAWTLAWWAAPALPPTLAKPLRTLLLPTQDSGENSLYLPVFDARTEPASSTRSAPTLLRKVSQSWQLESERNGDGVLVRFLASDSEDILLDLDFTMLREALACAEGHIGITERSREASPRLERFRAALLRIDQDLPPSYFVSGERGPFALKVEHSNG
jgi:hypothetical protein